MLDYIERGYKTRYLEINRTNLPYSQCPLSTCPQSFPQFMSKDIFAGSHFSTDGIRVAKVRGEKMYVL